MATSTIASDVRLYLLGVPSVVRGNETLPLNSAKALALLAYLGVTQTPQRREHLMALLWPDSAGEAAAKNLRNTLWMARKVCEGEVFSVDGEHLTLAPEIWCDVRAFESLTAQRPEATASPETLHQDLLALYTGPFLGSMSMHDAADLDVWITIERERLGQSFFGYLKSLITMHRKQGNWRTIVEVCQRALRLDNLQEDVHAALMEAYARQGERISAMRQYETLTRTLQDAFGLDPQPETTRLYQAIMDGKLRAIAEAKSSQETDNDTDVQQSIKRSSTRISERTADLARKIAQAWREQQQAMSDDLVPTPQSIATRVKMVGRSEVYGQMMKTFYGAEVGTAQALMLIGESGVGKTRLLREFLKWAETQQSLIYQGHCAESGGHLPYLPVVQALRPFVDGEDSPVLKLDSVWLGALHRIFPHLPKDADDVSASPHILYEAVARAMMAIWKSTNTKSIVLAIDDLQWADAASLEMLRYILQFLQGHQIPLMFIGALRTEELSNATPDVSRWLMDLERTMLITRLTLARLTEDDVMRLVEALWQGEVQDTELIDRMARWLHAETDGFPLHITEILQALLDRDLLKWQRDDDGKWGMDFAGLQGSRGLDEIIEEMQSFVPSRIKEVLGVRVAKLSTDAFELLTAAAVLGQNITFERMCRVADLAESTSLRALDEALSSFMLQEVSSDRLRDPVYVFTHDKIRLLIYQEMSLARRAIFHRRALNILQVTDASAVELAYHANNAGLTKETFEYAMQAGREAMDMFASQVAWEYFERAYRLAEAEPNIATDDVLAQLTQNLQTLQKQLEE